jgi:DNA-binding NtrC family response regulator
MNQFTSMPLLQQDGRVLFDLRRPAPVLLHDEDCALLVRPLAETERRAVESAIILCLGNLQLCAQRLGISRTGLRNKLNQYRILDGETPLSDRRASTPKTMAAKAGLF